MFIWNSEYFVSVEETCHFYLCFTPFISHVYPNTAPYPPAPPHPIIDIKSFRRKPSLRKQSVGVVLDLLWWPSTHYLLLSIPFPTPWRLIPTGGLLALWLLIRLSQGKCWQENTWNIYSFGFRLARLWFGIVFPLLVAMLRQGPLSYRDSLWIW